MTDGSHREWIGNTEWNRRERRSGVPCGWREFEPQLAAAGVMRVFHVDWPVTSMPFQALTGAMKLTIVLGYLLLIRRLPDIRRVFQGIYESVAFAHVKLLARALELRKNAAAAAFFDTDGR